MCVDESQAEEDKLVWLEFPRRPMLVTWASVCIYGVLFFPPHTVSSMMQFCVCLCVYERSATPVDFAPGLVACACMCVNICM